MFTNRDLRRLLVPLIIDQLLMSLIGVVDTIMVANVGATALSAVSLVDSINILILFLFSALGTGGTIVCSQYLGLDDKKAANNAARQLMISVFALSIVITVLCIIFRGIILRSIFGSVDDNVMSEALKYFYITSLAYPFIALNNASSGLFRATGNSLLPMLVSLGANVIHIAGNAILIFGFNMGVEGAAISTLVSRILGTIALLVFQHKPNQVITLNKILAVKPDMKVICMIMRIGIPTGIENCFFQFGKLMVQSTVSTLGTAAIAVQSLTGILEGFQSMPSIAIGLGLVTVAGYCMGAGRPDEARRYIIRLTVLSTVVLAISITTMLFLTKPVVNLAGMNAENGNQVIYLMSHIAAFKILLWPVAFIPPYGMRAAGDVKYTMIVSTASMFILRVGLCYFLIRYAGIGVLGVWIAMFADWFCRSIFFFVRFLRGKWMQNKVLV